MGPFQDPAKTTFRRDAIILPAFLLRRYDFQPTLPKRFTGGLSWNLPAYRRLGHRRPTKRKTGACSKGSRIPVISLLNGSTVPAKSGTSWDAASTSP